MSTKKLAIIGVKWNTISTIFTTVLQILKISILTRFLDSTDFGLMALVMLVLGFVGVFNDMGISVAILHKQEISKKQYASLFWFNMLVSIGLFMILVISAPYVAGLFSENELSQLIPLMALELVISAFGRQFGTVAHKKMQFKFITIVKIISGALGILLAVYLAMNGYGVYTLIYSALAQSVLSSAIFFIHGIRKYGLKIHFYLDEIIDFIKIGLYQTGSQVINYFTRELDILIIGKMLGSEVLGGYSLAKQLVFRPSGLFGSIVTSTVVPIFAKLQDNVQKLKEDFLRISKMINTLNFIIYLLLIIFAAPIVLLLYGEKYMSIVLLVQILSLYAYLRACGSFTSILEIVMGRTDLGFQWSIVSGVLLGGFILIGSYFNIIVMAVMMTLMMTFFTFLYWKLVVKKLLDIPLKSYMYIYIPDFKNMSQLITLIKKK